MSNLTQADYTRAIDAIVDRRDALIMDWATHAPNYHPGLAGVLEKIKGDLRELRRLQAGLAEESAMDTPIPSRVRHTPDWLMREHQND